jgi:class 3 adenylate cyclase
VLISDPTYRLVEDLVGVEELGPIQVKGKADPICVYQVVCLL